MSNPDKDLAYYKARVEFLDEEIARMNRELQKYRELKLKKENPVYRYLPKKNGSFKYLEDSKSLSLYDIFPESEITDDLFQHFKGIRSLTMSSTVGPDGQLCRHITDAAFKNLECIEWLDMSFCNQTTITDEAFKHLKGIQYLVMNSCNQDTITGEGFHHLKGIKRLEMVNCPPKLIQKAIDILGRDVVKV